MGRFRTIPRAASSARCACVNSTQSRKDSARSFRAICAAEVDTSASPESVGGGHHQPAGDERFEKLLRVGANALGARLRIVLLERATQLSKRLRDGWKQCSDSGSNRVHAEIDLIGRGEQDPTLIELLEDRRWIRVRKRILGLNGAGFGHGCEVRW